MTLRSNSNILVIQISVNPYLLKITPIHKEIIQNYFGTHQLTLKVLSLTSLKEPPIDLAPILLSQLNNILILIHSPNVQICICKNLIP